MEESLRRVLLCCALNCVVHVLSMENNWAERTDQELWRVNLYHRAILLYQDHVQKVQRENPDCVYNSTRNYENMNQITHRWKPRSSNASKNLHSLHKSMEENANSDLGILVQEINYLRDCLSEKEKQNKNTSKPLPSEAEWAQQVAEVKANLDATKKINEFYVMVENAKLAHKTNCYNEFSPLVGEFTARVELVFSNCLKFVPLGNLEEFRKCCDDLLQPTLSDIQTKLMYMRTCGT